MDCSQAYKLIREFLDEELDCNQEKQLNSHLRHCSSCKKKFQELQQTIALVQSASHVYAPAGFADKIMASLPKERTYEKAKKRMQQHPLLVAASLFFLLMTGSLYASWLEDDQNFQLIAAQTEKFEVDHQRNRVIVPADVVVHGDIIVKNADIAVEGKVEGNVIAVDGQIYLASTGFISGEKKEIAQAVEWVWYQLKRVVNPFIP